MYYADTVGLKTVLNRVRSYRDQFGDYWRPAPLIERLAASGGTFYGWSREERSLAQKT
jgi:3-hydroxyacyl-CoA dehydrogenase